MSWIPMSSGLPLFDILVGFPPYRPDLDPIEMAYAKFKTHLRRAIARTFEALFENIANT